MTSVNGAPHGRQAGAMSKNLRVRELSRGRVSLDMAPPGR